jgi:DNA helicase-2/ATP-dependent DNA helicase PcrA
MSHLLHDLNPSQLEAVSHIEGPCIVLAGAGSGKTRVITRRIVNLIEKGASYDEILAITFTNKAAQEMRSRVTAILPDYSGHWTQTFHAACYRILRMDIHNLGFDRNFTIVDDADASAVIKEILKEENDYETKPEQLLHVFKQVKNSLEDPEKYYSRYRLSFEARKKICAFTISIIAV